MVFPLKQELLSARGAYAGGYYPAGLPPLARGRGFGAITNLRTRFCTRCGVLPPVPVEVCRDPTSYFRTFLMALFFLFAVEELMPPAVRSESGSETKSVGTEWDVFSGYRWQGEFTGRP